ncbi:glycerol-3-phosphate dehydrogenase subunit GlpB [Halomarina oriensis]|uniref:Glycerol-3-phosphate dehydrogenase subunit GlpB n=1 Tax=Halomarina oriensis TaxID=671145 RepID=A0A6B0GMX9_9EURY|nr:glycerol-3-phosphate dehydrogenase subunit GlpB [Halomarina oriensis]
MAIEDDVLVVGGGLAGVTAALAAADTGVRVRLVSHKESTLRQASGVVDALGALDGTLVSDPYEAVERLSDGHPYRTLGADALRSGFDLFDGTVTGYEGSHTDANALVPTHGGTVKPTARYPESVAPGLASDDRPMLLVGFETLPDFDAPRAAAHLERVGVPFAVHGVTLDFPGNLRADAAVTRYADLLDEAVPVDGGRVDARTALVERVKSHLSGAERVGFPALLGHEAHDEVRAELSQRLGADAFEVPMGPPSLPGTRLADQLYAAMDDAGVGIETGNPVVDVTTDGERVTEVTVERTHTAVPYAAEQYVLATGGLVGKGIASNRESVRERVFDCHVPHPADRYDWSVEGAYGDHAFARFGVRIDADGRPLDASEDVEYENLRAAGGVVGGADVAAEKSASGVSLATGFTAGRLAGEEVS